MPAQTRHASPNKSAAADHGDHQVSAAKKAAANKKSPAKKTKTTTATTAAPNKKRSAAHHQDDDNKDMPEEFKSVVHEIEQLGPKRIKLDLLHKTVTAKDRLISKQDPHKAEKRAIVANELRRLSQDMLEDNNVEIIQPAELKQKVKAGKAKKVEKAKGTSKAVIKQIETLGEGGVYKLLHEIKPTKNGKKAASKIAKQKPAMDAKKVSSLTLDELNDLVTPTTAHRPSLVKGKIEGKKEKDLEVIQAVKKATVSEIKSLGPKGVQSHVKKAKK